MKKPTHALAHDPALDAVLDIPSISWSQPQGPFARGRSPTVAMNNNGQLVVIYANSIWTPVPELRARVGELDDSTITWHDERGFDTGSFPSVGINDQGQVVSTHHQNNGGANLFYNTGQISGNVVAWDNNGAGTQYTTGSQTSVDLNNSSLLVEVHRSHIYDTLWSTVGKLENGGITWLEESKRFDRGTHPSVALNNHNKVAQFHESAGPLIRGRVFDNAGELRSDNTMRWFDSDQTDPLISADPQVAMNDDGINVQIHQSANGAMWVRVGRLKHHDRKIKEGPATQFLQAFEYDVAMNNQGQIVVVYAPEDTTLAENLYYLVGTLSP